MHTEKTKNMEIKENTKTTTETKKKQTQNEILFSTLNWKEKKNEMNFHPKTQCSNEKCIPNGKYCIRYAYYVINEYNGFELNGRLS